MSEFFIEIGVEEIPSSSIAPAVAIFGQRLAAALNERGFAVDATAIKTFATPRRLAVSVDQLPDASPRRVLKSFGPPKKAGIGTDGSYTKAATGFAASKGVSVDALSVETTDKGEYLCVEIEEGGEATAAILTAIAPDIALGLPFPKSMKWGDGERSFTRPVHWVVALFEGVILPITVAGIAASNVTRGHRFLSSDPITVTGAADYESQLKEKGSVIADPVKRLALIREQAEAVARKNNVTLVWDEELGETVNYLTEWPVPLFGAFDEEYLALPDELIAAVLKDHQKMFVVSSGNALAAGFVGVSNMVTNDDTVVVAGYRRVARARLSDAMFFLTEDRKTPLADFAKKLDGVVYQKKLGTVGAKVTRIAALATHLAKQVAPELVAKVEKAARLCKADLETQMVYEFPELQGIMGREYALHGGEDVAVAVALSEHYHPRFSGDTLPASTLGAIVSVADRIDTITGIFGIGMIPTGAQDPFALRRHTLAAIHILNGQGWRIDLGETLDFALAQLAGTIDEPAGVKIKIIEFFAGRLKGVFEPQGISHDIIDAVVSAGIDDLTAIGRRVSALASMKAERPEVYEPLGVAFKRVANISKGRAGGMVDPALFEAAIETTLHDALVTVSAEVGPLVAALEYGEAMEKVAGLRPLVDQYFDDVLVMAEDEKVKENRLNLLANLAALFAPIADFSKLAI